MYAPKNSGFYFQVYDQIALRLSHTLTTSRVLTCTFIIKLKVSRKKFHRKSWKIPFGVVFAFLQGKYFDTLHESEPRFVLKKVIFIPNGVFYSAINQVPSITSVIFTLSCLKEQKLSSSEIRFKINRCMSTTRLIHRGLRRGGNNALYGISNLYLKPFISAVFVLAQSRLDFSLLISVDFIKKVHIHLYDVYFPFSIHDLVKL